MNSKLVAWGAMWFALATVVVLVAAPNLPNPIAIRWDGSGQAAGSASVWALVGLIVFMLVLGLALAMLFRVGETPSMESFALVGMTGGLGVAIAVVTATANWGLDSWTDAAEIGFWSIALLIGLPALGLGAGIGLGRHLYPVRVVRQGDISEELIEIQPGERINWVGRSRVKWVPLVLLVVAVALVLLIPDLPLWLFVLVAGLGLVFSQVEAQVTNDGMRIRLGGIPVRRLKIEDISSARSIDAVPTELGGWGWRVVPGATAIVLRAGDAIEVTFKTGRRFVVTVDDARTGAALLNGLVELGYQTG